MWPCVTSILFSRRPFFSKKNVASVFLFFSKKKNCHVNKKPNPNMSGMGKYDAELDAALNPKKVNWTYVAGAAAAVGVAVGVWYVPNPSVSISYDGGRYSHS